MVKRQKNAEYISTQLGEIPAITPPRVRSNSTHVYYVQGFKYDSQKADGVTRKQFIEAVKAELAPSIMRESEGVLISEGYTKPLYLLPMYQQQKAFGSEGYPFTSPHYKGTI